MVTAEKVKDKEKEKESKNQALGLALTQIEKQFGKGAIMKLGDTYRSNIPIISTGALSLDVALGIGGLPRGRVVEIFGPEASGKTSLSLSTVANAQKSGGTAAYIDAEHAIDPIYARKLGVKLDELLISQPDTGEQALDICDMLVRSNAIDIIVIDSVAALVPRAEIEGDMGDSHMGLQARLMSQAMRKLTSGINRSKTCVVFINQIRMKIGVMFGNPEVTTGGNALKFYASVRIDVRRVSQVTDGNGVIGNKIRAKIVKNKVAPPFRVAEFDLMFDSGISKEGCVLDMAIENNVIEKSGSWFSYGSARIGQGRENAKQYLKENPKIFSEIDKKVRDQLLTSPE